MRPLADMTEEERAECVGMWCEDTSGALCIYMGDARGFGVGAYPASRCTMSSFFDELTPRHDMPRAWQADGTPPAGEWLNHGTHTRVIPRNRRAYVTKSEPTPREAA